MGQGMAVTLGPVLAHIHPTGLTGSLSKTPLCMHHQPEVVCLGNISSPEAEGQKDRCRASNLEESPVPDVTGKSCKSHLLRGEGAHLCQDHSVTGSRAEAEAGLDPTITPAI